MSARRAVALAGALLAAACSDAPAPARSPGAARRPDVALVVLDTLRPDRLELFGHERETAPWLARLAQRAAVFERAFSTSSKTTPATASLFTGTYPNRHGVVRGLEATRKNLDRIGEEGPTTLRVKVLPRTLEALPELFQEAGYRTWGVSANTQLEPRMGFARGFERFECLDWTPAEDTLPLVYEWADEIRASEEPTFVYVHLIDPHHPYEAREPWYEAGADELEDARARYDSEIRYLDGHLERLSERLGWDADTLVCIVSDHGEEFLDHGNWGHRFSLYDELNRVLLLFAGPGVVPGRRAQGASLVDVLPTLAELVGLAPPAGLDGRSLAPLLRVAPAGSAPDDRPLFAHRARLEGGLALWSVVQGRWKLIQLGDGPAALFDLQDDPGETHDAAGEHPERADALRALLDDFRSGTREEPGEEIEIELDADELHHLQELGYVEERGE